MQKTRLQRLRSFVEETVPRKLTGERLVQWIVTGAEVAGKIGQALPSKYDTKVQAMLKTISVIHTVRSSLWQSTGDPLVRYATQYGLVKVTNETFVRIFFATDLHTKFTIGHVRISDYRVLIDARGPLGHFAFTKSDYGDYHDASYYMRDDVEMTAVLEGLWDQYEGRIHITVTPGIYGQNITQFSAFENIESPLFGTASKQMQRYVTRHRRCVAQKSPRSYMLYGPPGTGKTSFGMKFADQIGHRTLNMSAVSLGHISVKEMTYLLRHLAPEFVIIDDVDKITTGNALPTLLDIIQRFKHGVDQTLILTSNTIEGFDTGFLRPGRIDTWIEFTLPELDEREEVLGAYVKAMEVDVTPEQVKLLAIESEGLSQDYLREIVTELRQCGAFDEVVDLVRLQKRLLLKVEKAKAPKKGKGKFPNGVATVVEDEGLEEAPAPAS